MQTDNAKYNLNVKSNTAFLNELRNKLPEYFNGKNEFDLNKLKKELLDHNIDELKDGYQLNFIGKDYARRQAGEAPKSVIVPDKKQNNSEGKYSQNIFLAGDNLEVLRHLQNSYSNKIDMIYIDPPYNTGNDDFAYPDKFEYSDEKLESMFGLDDGQLDRLKSIQGKSSHSAWLAFMYPRLYMAKKLLSDDGVFFISIDDNENDNLREVMDEIFGEGNFVAQIVWEKVHTRKNSAINFSSSHEYILCYAKKKRDNSNDKVGFKRNLIPRENTDAYSNPDNDPNGPWKADPITAHNYYDANYTITKPDGTVIHKPSDRYWVYSKETLDEKIKNNEIIWGRGNSTPMAKRYLKNVQNGLVPTTLFSRDFAGDSSLAKKNIDSLFPESKGIFTYSKPVKLIKRLIQIGSKKDSIILDFFAGTSTTAEAVMRQNIEDNGTRKFIMVQIPEKTYHQNKDGKHFPTNGGRVAYEAGFKTIDEVSRERIRRASKNIQQNFKIESDEFDNSFKNFYIVKPNKRALADIDKFDPKQISLFNDVTESFSGKSLGVVNDGATGEETIMTTWLVKDGYSLDSNVKMLDFKGYLAPLIEEERIYIINSGWKKENTKDLLNRLGNHRLNIKTIVIWGYSFNIAEMRELEIGLGQLDNKINFLKRY